MGWRIINEMIGFLLTSIGLAIAFQIAACDRLSFNFGLACGQDIDRLFPEDSLLPTVIDDTIESWYINGNGTSISNQQRNLDFERYLFGGGIVLNVSRIQGCVYGRILATSA
jgi:hypothetical protein